MNGRVLDRRGWLDDASEARRPLLLPLRALYMLGARAVHALYDAKLLPQERAPLPVVSVGSLAFGGSGKTPVSRWLARRLAARGWNVAVLLRGYRGQGGSESRVVDPQHLDPTRDGDEACLLAATVPEAIVIAGANRSASARLAQRLGANVAILDDGHQHRRLSRTLDVLLWDRRQAEAAAAFPPALREPSSGAARAGLVLRIDRGEGAPPVPGGMASQVRIAGARLVSGGGEGLTRGARVHALSGIAHPASFERSLAARGLVVTGATRYPDHHAFRRAEIDAAAAHAQEEGAGSLAVTAKDFARSAALLRECSLPVAIFDLHVEVEEEDAVLDLIERRLRASPA
ncbi:MAG TPA: tetraacyldisaccharide 4'-kinase [bacterium]|nr:tetraacyldisaccharide 4'-kinase [bacterium]